MRRGFNALSTAVTFHVHFWRPYSTLTHRGREIYVEEVENLVEDGPEVTRGEYRPLLVDKYTRVVLVSNEDLVKSLPSVEI